MKMRAALLGAVAVMGLAPAAFAERGADGEVKLTFPQAVSIVNPYLSGGTKDILAAAMVVKPLAGFDPNGSWSPRLAEIPTLENGGVTEDMTSITWKLKPGLKWSDGTPVTADDAVFTWQYCTHPEGGCSQATKYEGVASVEAVDPQTDQGDLRGAEAEPLHRLRQRPVADPAEGSVRSLPRRGRTDLHRPNNMPIGTGPFMVTGFTVNDTVTMAANPNYRDPAKPAFATATIKGGGDAEGGGPRGDGDRRIRLRLEHPDPAGQPGRDGRRRQGPVRRRLRHARRADRDEHDRPVADLPEGERSTVKHPHPILSDIRVRTALSMAIDRSILVEVGYGAGGKPTCNVIPGPEAWASDNTDCLTQDMEGAKALLDEAGWTDSDGDGIRDKDGKKLSILYQTSVNPIRQDFQALIKDWWTELGVEVELKAIDPGVFFGGDPGSPDTFQKFYADVEMYANNSDNPDPETYLASTSARRSRARDPVAGREHQPLLRPGL
jgi:peptide/nickel transport system substrate-binding protein